MKSTLEIIPFILIILGTLGLLLNEFVFDWGRAATLLFAAANLIGLLVLAYSRWPRKIDSQ